VQGPEGNPPTVTVTGYGGVKALPDIAIVSLSAQARAATAADAQREAGRLIDTIIAGLREAGVPEADLERTNAEVVSEHTRLAMQRMPIPEGPSPILANQVLRVTVRDIARVGLLRDLVVARGATLHPQVTYAFRDPDAVHLPAYAAAVRQARAIAEVLATAAGLVLGEIVAITTDTAGHPLHPMQGRPMAADNLVPTPVGEQTVWAAVKVTFRLSAG
jgi:uncharacterized protein YggE